MLVLCGLLRRESLVLESVGRTGTAREEIAMSGIHECEDVKLADGV